MEYVPFACVRTRKSVSSSNARSNQQYDNRPIQYLDVEYTLNNC